MTGAPLWQKSNSGLQAGESNTQPLPSYLLIMLHFCSLHRGSEALFESPLQRGGRAVARSRSRSHRRGTICILPCPVGQEDVSGTFLSIPPCDSITVRAAAASPSVNPHYHHHPLQLLLLLSLSLSLSVSAYACKSECVFVCVRVQEDEEAGRRRRHQGRPFHPAPGAGDARDSSQLEHPTPAPPAVG